MRSIAPIGLTALLALSACGPGTVPGWRGANVHVVDGTWIGTETACGAGDEALECRTIVELTMEALPPDVRTNARNAVQADLPTEFVTASGETRTARVAVGILTRTAVVLDLVDGTRRVIGLMCHLPSDGAGHLHVAWATCELVPLEYWRDGNAPPRFP